MKKTLIGATAGLLVAAAASYAFTPKAPTLEEIESAVAQTWNVEEVEAISWRGERVAMNIRWKELPKAQEAAEQMCLLLPVEFMTWENKVGDAFMHTCGE